MLKGNNITNSVGKLIECSQSAKIEALKWNFDLNFYFKVLYTFVKFDQFCQIKFTETSNKKLSQEITCFSQQINGVNALYNEQISFYFDRILIKIIWKRKSLQIHK